MPDPASRFPSWPRFAPDEIEAAAAVLRSGRVNQWTGTEVTGFERDLAERLGRRHVVALANGTLALECGLRALGVGPGDEVVIPARTFIACASAVVAVGARPVVADVDPATGLVTAATLAARCTPRTRALMPVHLGGWPCDMTAISALARTRGLRVLEDCAQALGARWRGRPAGAFGDAAAFSFCQDKIVTTAGEGGALATDDPEVFERAWSWKDHGKARAAALAERPPGFAWVHEGFGTNGRLTEVQAAVGRAQLRKLDTWLACRARNAKTLVTGLRDCPGLVVPVPPPEASPAWYRVYAYLQPAALAPGWTRDRVLATLLAEGIPASTGSCGEIHREAAFPPEWRPVPPLTVAAGLGATSLAFRVDPALGEKEMQDTVRTVRATLEAAAHS